MPPPRCGGAQATTVLDAGDLRDEHGHERRREHRVAPAGDVRADGVDRDVAVAEHDAGPHLDLEVGAACRAAPGRTLRTWSWAKAMCSRSSASSSSAARSNSASDTMKDVGLPAVELARVAAHRVEAAALDVAQHVADPGAQLVRRLELAALGALR